MPQSESNHDLTPGVLGVFSAFDELADGDLRLGRKVANHGFIAAVLEHSSLSELHIYLPFYAALGGFEKTYAPWLQMPQNQKRVRLFPFLNLQAALERTSYLAIHAVEHHRYFPELCHQRNRWAREPFPITCTPHSLNAWESHTRNIYKVLPGPMPYDSIFCTSRAAREHLGQSFEAISRNLRQLGLSQAGYGGRLDLVPLGVDARQFGGLSREQALEQLGLEPGPVTVLCVGRLTPSDKYDLMPLLAALKLLTPKIDLRLVLAGAAHENYADYLKTNAAQMGLSQRLHIFPDFASQLKPALFAAADIYLSPVDNPQETFGLSIIEAMAASLPVVASDYSGYRDLVDDGHSGVLIPTLAPGDYRALDAAWPLLHSSIGALQMAQRTSVDLGALCSALAGLAQNAELRRGMGAAGRERVLRMFDWPMVIRQMERTWKELKTLALEQGKPAAQPDALAASQEQLFGGFASAAMQPGQSVALGPMAQAFAQGEWARQPHPDLAGNLPYEALRHLAGLVSQAGGQTSLERLQQAMRGRMPPYAVEHLVLHGIKYGILQPAGEKD